MVVGIAILVRYYLALRFSYGRGRKNGLWLQNRGRWEFGAWVP